ncbi:MAG: pitrilysin family protein [Synechococcaceae cyanobacterium]|nr:pitrilysin family protein [Synechococcaceae cyanobacterium]
MSALNPNESPAWPTLLGGLPVVLLERPGPAILAARLVIRGGSSGDPRGQCGAHQLLAGLMTRGCGSLDAEALADRVEGAGAALRAEAHEDALVIGLKCARGDAAELLPLLPAMVQRPSLAEDQLELERQLNLQTLQRQREDPFQLAHDQLRRQLYGAGPYGHDPLGCEEDLIALNRGQLQPLVAGLGSDGAVLVLCGDAPDQALSLIEQGLEGPWRTAMPSAGAAFQACPISGPRLSLQEEDTEQLVLMLGSPTVPLGHGDALALRLLQTHLGMGMSSRLFQVMREERGLAYDVGVHLPARCQAAPFVIHLSTSADRACEATAALLGEWRRLLEQPLSAEERHLAVAKFQGQDAMGRQTCSQIAERQALVLSSGLAVDHVDQCLRQAPGLSQQALQAAAQRWLPQPCLSLVGPAEALAAAERAWHADPLSCR